MIGERYLLKSLPGGVRWKNGIYNDIDQALNSSGVT